MTTFSFSIKSLTMWLTKYLTIAILQDRKTKTERPKQRDEEKQKETERP